MNLLRLLYPSRCLSCGADLAEGHVLCGRCLDAENLRLYDSFAVEGADGADAPLVYRGTVRTAMHAYKFGHRRAYGNWFAACAGDCLAGSIDLWKPELVTFVPLGFGRWMKRGYNQSGLAAAQIAKRFGLPCVRTMRKRAFVRTQSSLPHEKRGENIARAFRIRPNARLAGKRVLLVDDVVTTGATAAACVRVLRDAGASAVYVLSLTKTPVFHG